MSKINPGWLGLFEQLWSTRTFKKLAKRLDDRMHKGCTIYPNTSQVYRAFEFFSPEQTKVIILGQDPYHGPGQADGLAFSVNEDQKLPPSLRNIFIELKEDTGINRLDGHGSLAGWAQQGVLLMNSVLTVEKGAAASHSGLGWERITDTIIANISERYTGKVFILWGNHAQSKGHLIDTEKHLIISTSHPSPLAASKGFFGSKPFSKTNSYLTECGKSVIDWSK